MSFNTTAMAVRCFKLRTTKNKKLFRIMRLTALLLTVACLSAGARGTAQTIRLDVKDAPLEKVFAEIKKQAAYTFVYYKEDLAKADKITLKISNASIEEVLNQVFKNGPLTYTIVDKTIVVKQKEGHSGLDPESFSQLPPPIDVHGKIVNEKGEPVAASIVVKGTNKGTSTNDNGEFELKSISNDAVLVISGVSIETFEVKVNGRSELALGAKVKTVVGQGVTIEANTGYQTVKPNEVTGSLNVITNATLNQQMGTNILKRLDGVTTSIYFDTKETTFPKTTNITVRGYSSINGPVDPLVVLDGFIYDGDINNINPNAIENITILKDAAAASIWGAKAANGVIVITSKKGKFNQKPQVDFNSSVIFTSKPDLFYMPQMSSADYINVEQFLYSKGFYNSQFTNTQRPSLTPAVEIFKKRALGQISPADSAAQIDALKSVDVRNGYNKYFYANGLTQQYALGLRGGNSNNAYSLNVGYDKSVNELHAEYGKFNLKVENTFQPIKQLQATVSVFYTNSNASSGRPSYNSIQIGSRQPPYLQFADNNGAPLPVDISIRGIYTDTAGAGKLLNWKYYPLEDYKHDKTTSNTEQMYSIIGLNYKFTNFLNLDFRYQYQKQRVETDRLQDFESFAARNTINLFSQLNRATGVVTYIVPQGGIRSIASGTTETQTGRGQFNLNRRWKSHELVGILGSEIRQSGQNSASNTVYGYNEDPLTFSNVDFVNRYPTFIRGSLQAIPGSPQYANTMGRYVSVYTNVAYTLSSKYTATFSARRDGSNIFGVNTNKKWNPLWSAGIGWNVFREKFYDFSWLPYLRFRATYGYNGNVALNYSAVPVAVYGGNNSYTNYPVALINQVNNPELKWEKIGVLNLGIDFELKNQIISGAIDYYRKNGIDLYAPTFYDYTIFGLTNSIVKNVAEMKGDGIEAGLNFKNIQKKFGWSTNLIFNYQDNKVTKYFTPSAQTISTILGGGDRITPVVGKPLYAIAAYKWGGLDSLGNPQGFVNGKLSTNYTAINAEAQTGAQGNVSYMGSALPTIFGSLINNFSYKGVFLSVNISYKGGYYFRKPALSYGLLFAGRGNKEYEVRWQQPGDEKKTNVPSFMYPVASGRDAFYSNAEINVLKGDHIRLQYVNLSYSLRNLSAKLPNQVKGIEIYVNASNLGIIWKANKYGLDPEYPSSLQPLKTWGVGIRASF
jgi:TonB-linked SusC/RagA family outer membrane protein